MYAKMFFGEKIGFFITWIYWCAAWACNPIMIATAIGYLMSVTGNLLPIYKLFLEVGLVVSITLVNIKGVKTSGYLELILTILKIIPLIIVPIIAIRNIDLSNFKESLPEDMTTLSALSKATILSFWGFVGLEGATSSADSVENPKRTIPLAIVMGTALVAIICVVNTFAVFGIISPSELENVGAPFTYIMVRVFGGGYDKIIGFITFLMCAGSLNAWVLFSGQIAKSAATEKIFPKFFGKTNKNGAPHYGFLVSGIGTIMILILQKSPYFADKIVKFMDMSIIVYVVLYMIAILAYIKFYLLQKQSMNSLVITSLALVFCIFVLVNSSINSYIALFVMILTGIPIFWKMMKHTNLDENGKNVVP
jgi:APA family basic amino acid/polyamine antiporter